MKKQFLSFALNVFFVCIALSCLAQNEATTKKPAWVSDKGFWVVEGNVHKPESNTIFFYTLDRVLVYKEKIEGVKIKLGKKKLLLHLKRVLEQSVAAWEAQHIAKEDESRVAVALKY